jgi:hypothetical protein
MPDAAGCGVGPSSSGALLPDNLHSRTSVRDQLGWRRARATLPSCWHRWTEQCACIYGGLGAPEELDQIKLLQSIEASALFVQMLPANWSLSIRVSAGIAGDFAAIDRRLLRFNALVMAKHAHALSDRFVLGGCGGALTEYAIYVE